ncbi:MAG TPA: hypothetical protein VL282_15950 [Tepidisphaeraceae bacterium]|jgi:hypothetical protein|nr:hypothetical protein [Tepidisphaeraceae bacterium]
MTTSTFYIVIASTIVVLTITVVHGLMFHLGSQSPDRKRFEAHRQALIHLAEVMRGGADRAPDPQLVRTRIATVMEFLEYPARGKIGDWEAKVVDAIYDSDDEPTELWDKAMEELFEFARENLDCGFAKARNVKSYECAHA